MREIDFKLIKDKATNKVFKFTNADGTVYDLTGSTVNCELYLAPSTPTNIECTLDIINGKVIIPLTTTHSATEGIFEYKLIQTKGVELIPLAQGNVSVIAYVPFSETIEAYLNTELPANISLTENYRVQRITYWRRFLMGAFNIPLQSINIDSSWPILVNALIAKLVAYDALMLAARGNLLQFFGGDYTQTTGQGGPVAKIETGPSNVEYFSTASAIQELFKANADGSSLDTMISDICGLANMLKVKLPMCKYKTVHVLPKYSQNEDWLRQTEERIISRDITEQTTI